MSDNANLRSFSKTLTAGKSFDLTAPWVNRRLTIYNPNAGSLLIWCGDVPTSAPNDPVDDAAAAPSSGTLSGDLEANYSVDAPVDYAAAVAFIRANGVPLAPGAYWEPYAAPSSDVHIVYEDEAVTFNVRGIV